MSEFGKIEVEWLYGDKLPLFDHEKFWTFNPIVKPSPEEMLNICQSLKESNLDINLYHTWQMIPYIKKLCCIRNELGLWTHFKVANPLENDDNVFFINKPSMLSAREQDEIIVENLNLNSHQSDAITSQFYFLGCLNKGNQRMLFVNYKFHLQKSINTKTLRDLCNVLVALGFTRLFIVSRIPITPACMDSMKSEYTTIEIEHWCTDELYDVFSSRLMSPCAIIRRGTCNHDNDEPVCVRCNENAQFILNEFRFDDITSIFAEGNFAKIFRAEVGDIIVVQRERTYMFRKFVNKPQI